MFSRLSSLLYSFATCVMLCTFAAAQTPNSSASSKITTATCGKPLCTWNAFGPTPYTRDAGQPQTVSNNFSVFNPNTQFILHVDNNGAPSAVISINGDQIFGPTDFNPNATTLDHAVTLATSNTLQVQLRGKPGSSLALTISGVDNDPPSIIESAAPPPNSLGWNNTNVNIAFACSDATSGVASCPAAQALTTEGLNQAVAGTAFDLAGNSVTASLQASIDKTPPTILPTQNPPANSFGWNKTPVIVTFLCNDNLSGVQTCAPPVSVTTEGQNQTVIGTTTDLAGNSATTSAAVSIDLTPPVISIASPANGANVTAASLQLTGTASDNLSGVAMLTCNGAPAVLSSSTFSCNVSLVSGANTIQVQASDKAGNTASTQLSVMFNATPATPPNSILITPSLANMLIGDTRPVALIGDIGQPVSSATWSISDPTIVSITPTDPPRLTALAQGTATLTATFNGLTAMVTINILVGTTPPPGTPLWAFDPLPGNTLTAMVPGNPVNLGDPDLYAVEAPDTLRAFTKDGLQLWAVSPDAAPSSVPPVSAASLLRSQSPRFETTSLATIPTPLQNVLRKHGAFEGLDLFLRQQRFIERHRRKIASLASTPLSPNQSSLISVPSFTNTAAVGATTMLIRTVPDNTGGTINLAETFSGCCDIAQSSLIKIDNATQQQVWRHDFPGPIDENLAIGADNTIYSSQLIFTGTTNIFFGSSSTSLIFALDGKTGQPKFSLPLPPGHIKVTTNPGSAVEADLDIAAQLGPLSILPDGSINTLVATNHLTETFNQFLDSTDETSVSDHKMLQLLTVQPDGSFTTQTVQNFDFEQTGCQGGCNDPGASYFPNEVVPDGLGGLLATWTGNDSQLGITSGSAALVRHFDPSGGILDYAVPFASSSWFRVGLGLANVPQQLVVGENGIAFGSDGQSIIAFGVNDGSEQWTFQPVGFQGSALLAPATQGGLAAVQLADFNGEFDANPTSLVSFDSTGTLTTIPFSANPSSLIYFDPATLLAVAASGQGGRFNSLASSDPRAAWVDFGNFIQQRVAPLLPTYFIPLEFDPLLSSTACPMLGQLGSGLNVHYQVFDQYGQPFPRAGITPLEQVMRNGVVLVPFMTFSTPTSTGPDGKFDDDPVAECAGPPLPPPGAQECKSSQQQFEVGYQRMTYKINTNTAIRACIQGVSIQILGNPAGNNPLFSAGTVN